MCTEYNENTNFGFNANGFGGTPTPFPHPALFVCLFAQWVQYVYLEKITK